MRCKYTKFSHGTNGSEIFFFVLAIRALTLLSKITKVNYMLISINDRLIILLLTNNLSISVKSQLPDC